MSRVIRQVTEVLGLLSRGRFFDKVNEHLSDACQTLEGLPDEKGSATITITLKLNYQSGLYNIVPAVKSKLPEETFAPTPFWAFDGGLSVQHPSQSDMFVREARDTAEAEQFRQPG